MNAIVTGATRGIGKAIAVMFAEKGFNIAMTSRSLSDLEHTKSELLKINPNGEFITIAADLSNKNEVLQFSAAVKTKWNKIDVLVNNAGLFAPNFMLNEEDEFLGKQMDVNFYSAHYLTKSIVPLMVKQQKGHVFFICSAVSIQPMLGSGSYAVSKAAMKALADNWREELRKHYVKVTTIMPFATYTSSWEGTNVPQSKFIQAEDVASAVLSAYYTSPNAAVEEVFINNIQSLGL